MLESFFMEMVNVVILEPKAMKILRDLESLKLIKLERTQPKAKQGRKFGSMKGLVLKITDDFDEPLENLEDYT